MKRDIIGLPALMTNIMVMVPNSPIKQVYQDTYLKDGLKLYLIINILQRKQVMRRKNKNYLKFGAEVSSNPRQAKFVAQ